MKNKHVIFLKCRDAIRAASFTIPLLFISPQDVNAQSLEKHYDKMAGHIVRALQPEKGEQAILRYDPRALPGFEKVLRKSLKKLGVKTVLATYDPVDNFKELLDNADIYVWLPASPNVPRSAAEGAALVDWLMTKGGRQVHFHWGDGTRGLDGANREHSAAYDSVYLAALDIDYKALDAHQEKVIAALREGEIHVTTPEGTNLRFEIGDRHATKQNGDASKTRTDAEPVPIGREMELPAGAVRIAPLERTVNGTLVIPEATFGDAKVNNLELHFSDGEIERFSADEGEDAFRNALESMPALKYFREIGIGFNPKLVTPPGREWVAYYGYGVGIVRLALGNNQEIGGEVRGNGVRWLFFRNASISVGGKEIMKDGRFAR